MGTIKIQVEGSFYHRRKEFSAQQRGHAQAVAEAIQFLSTSVLPGAIEQDHVLHEGGHMPSSGGFSR